MLSTFFNILAKKIIPYFKQNEKNKHYKETVYIVAVLSYR